MIATQSPSRSSKHFLEISEFSFLHWVGYRKILCISNKNRVTNDEVRAKIQQAIGPHGDLLTIVK